MNFIPYGRQDISQEDISSVIDVLNSDFLTQGPKVPEFELSVRAYTGAKFSFAVNSATSGLHIACLALDVKPGDIVWTTPVSFVASSNCALYCGAKVDFVDIDPKTYNISVEGLERKLEVAKKNKVLPKVLIPVHLTGQPCEMNEIHRLSVQYGFKVIEDASHAIGADYEGEKVGNCKYSDITVFSFHPVKIVTSAEGGMALTNCEKLAKKLELLRSHGITRNNDLMVNKSHGPWYYEQLELGYNYRMTDIQAALGTSQMKRLDKFIASRRELANTYNKELQRLPITLPYQSSDGGNSYHLYVIRLNLSEIKYSHKETFIKLRELGIGVNLHYMPIYLQPYYQKLGFTKGYCPNAETYYSEAISIPMYPSIGIESTKRVIDALKEVL